MSLKLPEVLEHYWHDDIVRVLMKLNSQYHSPNRGSWLEGIPDLEDANREVVEVALTNLRDAWGQCLYYYRMNATYIHLVLAPKLYLDYQNKEKAFIKANPIPSVDVYTLPKIVLQSINKEENTVTKKLRKKAVHNPVLKFIVTEEDKLKLPKISKKESPVGNLKTDFDEGDQDFVERKMREEEELLLNNPTEVIPPFQEVKSKDDYTCSKCKELVQEKDNPWLYCKKYNWEIAHELTERDAVCVGG